MQIRIANSWKNESTKKDVDKDKDTENVPK